MREEGVDAGDGLLRILGVHFIFSLAILFGDGEDTQSLECFKRVGRFWMYSPDANGKIVTNK